MNDYLFALIFLLLAIAGVIVRKTYYFLPAHEWKRRAEVHDALATRIYPAVAYGESLRVFLWIWISFTTAAALVLLVNVAPLWLVFIAIVLLLWVVSSWLPSTRLTRLGMNLTSLVTPPIVWLLNYLHRPLSRSARLIQKSYTAEAHTGLFERSDLLDLVEQQHRQSDSRLSDHELELVRRALNFSEYKVSEVLIPRKKVKVVLAKDTVGPVLIDELHKNGLSHVLVRETPKGEFAGTLAFADLDIHSSGKVSDFMDKGVFYVHADDSLEQALGAFFMTHQPLFVVINSFEEFVGIITVESVLRQLFGELTADDFDNYSEKTVVAARHPRAAKKKKSEASADTSVKTEKEVVE